MQLIMMLLLLLMMEVVIEIVKGCGGLGPLAVQCVGEGHNREHIVSKLHLSEVDWLARPHLKRSLAMSNPVQESKANNLEPPLIVSVHGAIGQVVVEGGKRKHILSLQAPVMVEQIAPMRTETQNNELV